MASFTSHLAQYFDPATRGNGVAAFRLGGVRGVQGTDDMCKGSVSGDRTHLVELEYFQNELTALCDCAWLKREKRPCQHIWAVLLEAEKRNLLRELAKDRVLSRLQFIIGHREHELGSVAPAKNSGALPPDPLMEWESSLKSITKGIARANEAVIEPPPGREIVYGLEKRASHSDHGWTLTVAYRAPKRNGELGKPQPWKIPMSQLAQLPDASDRRILMSLAGSARSNTYWRDARDRSEIASEFAIEPSVIGILLPDLARTGRLHLTDGGTWSERSVAWHGDEPWRLRLTGARDESEGVFEMSATLARGESRMDVATPHHFIPGAFVFYGDHVAPLDDARAFVWITYFREKPPLRSRLADAAKLITALMDHPALPPLDIPDDLRYEEVKDPPRACLELKSLSYRPDAGFLEASLAFEYGARRFSAIDPSARANDPANRRVFLRDRVAERNFEARLLPLGFKFRNSAYDDDDPLRIAKRNVASAVSELVAEGWVVTSDGKLYRNAGVCEVEVSDKVDWFELRGVVDYGDDIKAGLPELLAAAKRGDEMIALSDGSLGALPKEWMKKHGLIAAAGKAEGDCIKFKRNQAVLLDVLLASQPEARCDEVFAKVRAELRNFAGVAAREPVAEFRGTLRGYQKDGLGWFDFLRRFGFGGCLADDMGLGKTVMVLAMLAERRLGVLSSSEARTRSSVSLVVVPRSLVFNWMTEAARFAPHLRVLDHSGIGRSKADLDFSGHDVVLTTYGVLQRDIVRFKEIEFDYCVLDEAQAIKNNTTARAKSVRLLQARHRLVLSGTPVENHIGELWSLFEFLNPGLLGASSVFQTMTSSSATEGAEGRALLAQAIRPFILRRTKKDVLTDLPEKTEQTIHCEIEGEQKRLYGELRDHYRASLTGAIDNSGLAKSKIQILEALLRLRQAACHPGLVNKDYRSVESAKIDMLLPRLRDVLEEGHKALVFSQFTSFLALVKERLDAEKITYEYLDGKTRDREAKVKKFQEDPECRLFLISLKAGGLGLNLTAADYVFLLDPWWNPAVEQQAVDRSHRIGQTRPVHAYRLIARGTVEEKVLELQETKKNLAAAILGQDNSLIRDMTREDLELLLS